MALLLLVTGRPLIPTAEGGGESPPSSPWTSVVKGEAGLLEWSLNGRKLLAYAFAHSQFKPYVRELHSLAGTNVLRDAPADHLHHHGLMYAIRVNGVNFWEERDQPGHQRHVKMLAQHTGRNAQGLPQASFTELLHWVADGDHTRADTASVALLVERRTLTLTVDESRQEVALAWHAEFDVGDRTNRVTLRGSDYNGLGLRLPAAWDHIARHVNSEGTSPPVPGKPGVVPARWSAVSSTAENGAMQVALFARPGGHAGTNAFFTMTDPFTYVSVTQSLDKKPLEYHAGDRFSLDYLVLVFPVAQSGARLEERYRTWTKEIQQNATVFMKCYEQEAVKSGVTRLRKPARASSLRGFPNGSPSGKTARRGQRFPTNKLAMAEVAKNRLRCLHLINRSL